MADHSPTGPVETGADMDYAEHDKTYHLFLNLAKYGSMHVIALMIAMAFGFFTSAGFFSAAILFVLLVALGDLAASLSRVRVAAGARRRATAGRSRP